MTLCKARNPRTGSLDYTFSATSPSALATAAARLRAAAPAWSLLPIEQRAAKLRTFADTLVAHRNDITAALELDTGRRGLAGLEVGGAIGIIAGWAAQAQGLLQTAWATGRSNPAIRHAPQFRPYAVVGVISPWNFPFLLGLIDAIPALLAGCTVMLKPSEVTPRFVVPLLAAVEQAGMGDVFSIVQGGGLVGAALVGVVDAVCFTGSVATGRKVAVAAAERLIPAFLELGGKDPLVVLESADIEAATDAALRASVLATGQACQSIERIYVQRPLHEAFVARLVAKADAVRLNWPDIAVGEIGPIIFEKQADVLAAHISDAQARGARVLTGGVIERHGGGLWLRPTVIVDVTPEMQVMTEETFGPILPVMAFDTAEEAVRLANDTEFGLSAAVFAGTLEEAEEIGRQIEAGAVSLNDAGLTASFYEAEKNSFKLSGMGGSRMGSAGFKRFLRRKALIANTGPPMPLS